MRKVVTKYIVVLVEYMINIESETRLLQNDGDLEFWQA